jgi:hypothetical protein
MDNRSFRLVAAIAAILSLPLAYGSFVTGLLAVDFNMAALSEPLLLIRTGPRGAELWRWSMLLDMLGYYLLIVPIVLLLWRWLKAPGGDWIRFFTVCLLSYCLIGAMGAAILAATLPPLIVAWQSAAEAQQVVIETVFSSYMNAVYRGLWNILEEFIAGFGWLGLGLALKGERGTLGLATIILGSACILDSIGSMLNVEALAMPGLYVYLLLAPIWACWLGVSLLRRPLAVEVG